MEDGQITEAQAETLVSTGLNGAPLNEDAQVYFYAGASGVSFMDAAKLGEDLSIDGETAYAVWKKGTEIRAENDKARFKPETSLANPTLAKAVSDSKNNAPGIIDRKGRRIAAKGKVESRDSVGDSSVGDSSIGDFSDDKNLRSQNDNPSVIGDFAFGRKSPEDTSLYTREGRL